MLYEPKLAHFFFGVLVEIVCLHLLKGRTPISLLTSRLDGEKFIQYRSPKKRFYWIAKYSKTIVENQS